MHWPLELMNKYKLPLLITLLLAIPFFSIMAIAIPDPLGLTSVQQIIVKISALIRNLAIAISPVMFVYGGIRFITSAGNPEGVKTAQRIVTWTFVGLLVVIGADVLISVIMNIIG